MNNFKIDYIRILTFDLFYYIVLNNICDFIK